MALDYDIRLLNYNLTLHYKRRECILSQITPIPRQRKSVLP